MARVSSLKIFVIEDDPIDFERVKAYLARSKMNKFVVEHACLLSDGLKKLGRTDADVILLDLHLPDSGGLDTFMKVYQLSIETPVILLTGHDDDRLATEAVAKGAQDYLIKSDINAQVLERAINYAVERKRIEKELRKANQDLSSVNEQLRKEIETREKAQASLQSMNDTLLELKRELENKVEMTELKKNELVVRYSEIAMTKADLVRNQANMVRQIEMTKAENAELKNQLLLYFRKLEDANREIYELLHKN